MDNTGENGPRSSAAPDEPQSELFGQASSQAARMFSESVGDTAESISGVSSGVSSEVSSGFPSGSSPRPIARKEYYSISEVCDLVDLRPHVLRYWETQFALLSPSKNRSGNRVYQRKEIRLILLVKHLLYEEKYTVEGAKQKLEQLRKGGELQKATKGALDKQMVQLLRAEMQTLTEVLTPPRHSS
ncbi:MAG: MerR family transcriptional regulator [Longimicrobiales bacterium]